MCLATGPAHRTGGCSSILFSCPCDLEPLCQASHHQVRETAAGRTPWTPDQQRGLLRVRELPGLRALPVGGYPSPPFSSCLSAPPTTSTLLPAGARCSGGRLTAEAAVSGKTGWGACGRQAPWVPTQETEGTSSYGGPDISQVHPQLSGGLTVSLRCCASAVTLLVRFYVPSCTPGST